MASMMPHLCVMYLLCLVTWKAHAELCRDKLCLYNFDVRWAQTMTYFHEATKTVYDVEARNDRLEIVGTSVGSDPTDQMVGQPVSASDVITGDGKKRNVIIINGQFPGPTIEVMVGTEVVVHVQNNLVTDALTVHWHGMHQRGTHWMDGVANVTQSPVAPAQNFTYRFTASPGGAHWYHSHLLNQRDDGLYGALLVHRLETTRNVPVVLSQLFLYNALTVRRLRTDEDEMAYHRRHVSTKHASRESFEQHNILVNGRGRSRIKDTTLPLSVFRVDAGQGYRFHVIHAGADHGMKVSIDGHNMTVLAMDGFEVEPTDVHMFYIYPGESLEFEFIANASSGEAFWMRVFEVMLHAMIPGQDNSIPEHSHDNKASMDHDKMSDEMPDKSFPMKHTVEGRAILQYGNLSNTQHPNSTAHNCSAYECVAFNCPGGPSNTPGEECILLDQMKGWNQTNAKVWEKLRLTEAAEYTRVLNFIFSGKPGHTGSSVNGKKFLLPRGPIYDPAALVKECSKCTNCRHCTHIESLPSNTLVELILTNVQGEQSIYAHHPMHLHGYSFAIMEIGLPTYDNGIWTPAKGLKCHDRYCDEVEFKRPNVQDDDATTDDNQTRRRRRRQHAVGIQFMEPLLKDTVLVPANGYVVVRLFTDNPGAWLMHCHVAQHLLDGMALLLHVPRMPTPPDNFTSCFNDQHESRTRILSASTSCNSGIRARIHRVFILILNGFVFLLHKSII